jgi:hypothetical protein
MRVLDALVECVWMRLSTGGEIIVMRDRYGGACGERVRGEVALRRKGRLASARGRV